MWSRAFALPTMMRFHLCTYESSTNHLRIDSVLRVKKRWQTLVLTGILEHMFEESLSPSQTHRVLPEALVDAVAINPCTGTDRDVVDALTAIAQLESRIAAHKAKLIAELVRRQPVVRPGGFGVEPVHYPGREQVAAALNISCKAAEIEVDYALRLTTRPGTLAALATGDLTTRAARVLVHETLNLSDEQIAVVETDALTYARTHTPAEVKRRINRTLQTRFPAEQLAQHAAAAAGREVAMYPGEHGMAILEATLPCHEANLVFGYLNQAADCLKNHDRQQLKDAGLPTNELASRGTYRADALVALAAANWVTQSPQAMQPNRGTQAESQAAKYCPTAQTISNNHNSDSAELPRPRTQSGDTSLNSKPSGSDHNSNLSGNDHKFSATRYPSTNTNHEGTGEPPATNTPSVDGNHEISAADSKLMDTSAAESAVAGATQLHDQTADAQVLGRAVDGAMIVAGEALVNDVISAGTIVNIVMDFPTAVGLADNPAELRGYGPIPAGLAREMAANATWRRWITDDNDNLINVGTSRYRPTPALREFIIARDQRCRFPGCHQPAQRCDIDHAIPFERGGPTDASNLGALCRRHHRIKTGSDWDIINIAADGTYTWLTPTGEHVHRDLEPLLPQPAATPP